MAGGTVRAVVGAVEHLGQQLLLAELEHTLPDYPDEWYWNDAWDGYPLARARLLSDVVRTKVSNPVFVTGDWHSTFVNDLKVDFKDPASPTVATEFVTPASDPRPENGSWRTASQAQSLNDGLRPR